MRRLAATLLFMGLIAAPLTTLADDDEAGLSTMAVQNRLHFHVHELSAFIGVLPLDAFTKGLTFTGAYTVHFSELLAWEVAQFTYSYPIDTDLVDELAELQAGPTPFESVKYLLTSGILFTPIYGKLAVVNKHLIFGELFLSAGAGYAWLTASGRFAPYVGGGLRAYANEYVSVRLDVRNYFLLANVGESSFELDLKDELWIGLALAISLG